MFLWKMLRSRMLQKHFGFVTVVGALIFGAAGPADPVARMSATNDEVEAARKALQSRVSRVRTMLQDQRSEAMKSGTSQDIVQWYNADWANQEWNNGWQDWLNE